MPKISKNFLKCCRCSKTESNWWYKDYDDKGKWTGKRICYVCKLEIEREKNRKAKDDNERLKNKKCVKCGSIETYINPEGYDLWARFYDNVGKWDGKSYLCNLCSQRVKQELVSREIKRIKEKRLIERKCVLCECAKTIRWYKYYEDKKWLGRYLCKKCYMKNYNAEYNCHNNIKKSLRNCRICDIDLSKFETFTENEKGRIGEDIVAETLNLENQNIISDNYTAPFDLVDSHGIRFQIKISTFDNVNRNWDFTIGYEHKFDILIILCMDKERPWKDVKRVYVIPEKCNELYGKRYISIFEGIESKWERYRVDEEPYNDAYHRLILEKYSVLIKIEKEGDINKGEKEGDINDGNERGVKKEIQIEDSSEGNYWGWENL